jgi:hypothetical protein
MCFRQITCCDPAIPSITFPHDEDMQPFDTHGKKRVDMIVQMDAVARKKAGGDSLTHLRRMDQSSALLRHASHTRTVSQARRTRQEQKRHDVIDLAHPCRCRFRSLDSCVSMV